MRGEEGKNSPLPSAPLSKTRLFCRGRKKFGAEKNKLLCFHKTTRALRHGVRRLFRFLSVGALGSCIRSGEQEEWRRKTLSPSIDKKKTATREERRLDDDAIEKTKGFRFPPPVSPPLLCAALSIALFGCSQASLSSRPSSTSKKKQKNNHFPGPRKRSRPWPASTSRPASATSPSPSTRGPLPMLSPASSR